MKFFVFSSLLLIILSSCTQTKDYDKAAKKLCDCMQKKQSESKKEQPSDTLGINLDLTDLNYSICMLEIITIADPQSPELLPAIEKQCVDLKAVHQKYLEGFKQ